MWSAGSLVHGTKRRVFVDVVVELCNRAIAEIDAIIASEGRHPEELREHRREPAPRLGRRPSEMTVASP